MGHVDDSVLAPVRERYGEPRVLRLEQPVGRGSDLVVASGRHGRRHDITFFAFNGARLALIRKPQFAAGVWRPPSGGIRPGESLEVGTQREAWRRSARRSSSRVTCRRPEVSDSPVTARRSTGARTSSLRRRMPMSSCRRISSRLRRRAGAPSRSSRARSAKRRWQRAAACGAIGWASTTPPSRSCGAGSDSLRLGRAAAIRSGPDMDRRTLRLRPGRGGTSDITHLQRDELAPPNGGLAPALPPLSGPPPAGLPRLARCRPRSCARCPRPAEARSVPPASCGR